MNAQQIVLMIVFAFVGLLVGWLYFLIMRFSLTVLARKKGGALVFFGLAIVRLLLLVGALVAAVQVGAWCLITCMAGFVVARTVVVSVARSEGATPGAREEEDKDKGEEKEADG